jgi:ABC-type antimicrobial peptide transport system ATPase subunit
MLRALTRVSNELSGGDSRKLHASASAGDVVQVTCIVLAVRLSWRVTTDPVRTSET